MFVEYYLPYTIKYGAGRVVWGFFRELKQYRLSLAYLDISGVELWYGILGSEIKYKYKIDTEAGVGLARYVIDNCDLSAFKVLVLDHMICDLGIEDEILSDLATRYIR